jgi:hypothetical protein
MTCTRSPPEQAIPIVGRAGQALQAADPQAPRASELEVDPVVRDAVNEAVLVWLSRAAPEAAAAVLASASAYIRSARAASSAWRARSCSSRAWARPGARPAPARAPP